MMEKYIEESGKMATMTVMDSLSMRITMSMTVNGRITRDTEMEFSRRHQLEKLKKDFTKTMKLKKSFIYFKGIIEEMMQKKNELIQDSV